MIDALFYKLSEAEQLLSVSRDTLLRFERAGLIVFQGKNHGKRVTGASLRALAARIEQGEDLWATLADVERARSAPKPTARARSSKTNAESGGTSHPRETASDSLASAPIPSQGPSWLKEIT